MNRQQFLSLGAGAALALGLPLKLAGSVRPGPEAPLDPALVHQFVGAAHRDLDTVQALLTDHPTLLNAAHDWGGGDFETALGAASHVGQFAIADYLIAAGAQTNVFTACLYGQLDIVRGLLDVFPATLQAKGPHGFTLLHHAIRGGERAAAVRAYLESLGATATKVPLF